eukprot:6348126-Amphidinium_carterae.1
MPWQCCHTHLSGGIPIWPMHVLLRCAVPQRVPACYTTAPRSPARRRMSNAEDAGCTSIPESHTQSLRLYSVIL